MSTITSRVHFLITREDEEIELDVYGEGYYDPGKLYGPPENCYPPEGEIEIKEIYAGEEKFEGKLTDDEETKIVDLLWENYTKYDPGDLYDDYDRNY